VLLRSWKAGNKKRRLREMEAARRGQGATRARMSFRYWPLSYAGMIRFRYQGRLLKKPSQPVLQQAPLAVDTTVKRSRHRYCTRIAGELQEVWLFLASRQRRLCARFSVAHEAL